MADPAWLLARNSWKRRARAWKKTHGYKDADLAAELEVKRSTVSSWLNGRAANLDDVLDLIEAMGADPGYILFDQPLGQPLPEGIKRAEKPSKPSKARAFKAKRQALRRLVIAR